MSDELWAKVDQFIADTVIHSDEALDFALRESERAGLPAIQVSAAQGKLLHLLARVCGAKRILEIGTLAGYSTIWLARALPEDGQLISLESEPKHAEVARENLAHARLAETVDLRVGLALDLLPAVAGPFDFTFIDADKEGSPDYFSWALKLSRVGSLIIVDNVVRKGALADSATEDTAVLGAQRLHEMIAQEPRVSATTIQTVGSKGYDGFVLAMVVD